ncbi:MAG: response regulator [Granulosicoccus sp.]
MIQSILLAISERNSVRHSILIVDDSTEDRYLLKRYLKKSGLDTTVVEVSNGEQGLDFLTGEEEYSNSYSDIQPPLLVFLDINMPIMNGWEFLEELRQKQDQVQIRPTIVVMYSTSDRLEDKERIAEYDFVKTYIVKGSYTPVELKSIIEDCIRAPGLLL